MSEIKEKFLNIFGVQSARQIQNKQHSDVAMLLVNKKVSHDIVVNGGKKGVVIRRTMPGDRRATELPPKFFFPDNMGIIIETNVDTLETISVYKTNSIREDLEVFFFNNQKPKHSLATEYLEFPVGEEESMNETFEKLVFKLHPTTNALKAEREGKSESQTQEMKLKFINLNTKFITHGGVFGGILEKGKSGNLVDRDLYLNADQVAIVTDIDTSEVYCVELVEDAAKYIFHAMDHEVLKYKNIVFEFISSPLVDVTFGEVQQWLNSKKDHLIDELKPTFWIEDRKLI